MTHKPEWITSVKACAAGVLALILGAAGLVSLAGLILFALVVFGRVAEVILNFAGLI